MSGRIDYDRMASVYDDGRAFPKEWLSGWRDALSKHLSQLREPVVDLGSGTGIWSVLLTDWFELQVVAIEPSSAMRSRALRKRSHAGVTYIGGEAEHLPLRDGVCAAAWLSTVVHHIPDLRAAAREARRVLQPQAPVLIRSAFSGRHHDIVWTRFFPSALRLAETRHPSVEATVEAFSEAGFEKESLQRVSELSAPNLVEYAKRIEARADSTLTLISDEEFERGLADLRRAAENESPSPVTTVLDLLVLR